MDPLIRKVALLILTFQSHFKEITCKASNATIFKSKVSNLLLLLGIFTEKWPRFSGFGQFTGVE